MQNHINASNISVMTEDESLKFFQEQLKNPVNPYFKKDKLKKIETLTISINAAISAQSPQNITQNTTSFYIKPLSVAVNPAAAEFPLAIL